MRTQILNGKKYCKFSEIIKNRNEYIDYYDKGLYQYVGEYDLLVWVDYKVKNEYIIIPKNYIFDFGSIPCFARCIADKDDYISFLVHDRFFDKSCEVFVINEKKLSPRFKKLEKYGFGYSHIFGEEEKIIFKYNRKFGDNILYEFMKEEDIEILRKDKTLKHKIIYYAVRLGGARHFRSK